MSDFPMPLSEDAHSLALLETLLAGVPVGIAYVDTNRHFQRVNERFAALYGSSRNALTGLSTTEIPGSHFGEIVEPLLARALRDAGNTSDSLWTGSLFDARGEAKQLALSCYTIRGKAETILGAALVVRDIMADASADNERRHQVFMRDVLASVTGGRLRFCVNAADLPERLSQNSDPIHITRAGGIRELRKEAEVAAHEVGMEETRWFDMETAIGEAAMNALVHAGGGVGNVGWNPQMGLVQVWITDTGNGITMENLPRATLEPGFTTADSMGHGFPMMIQTCDRIYLLTGSGGSTVVLEQGKSAPDPLALLRG